MAGLELLYASVQGQIQGREDAVVCCLHWSTIAQNLKCIGIGDKVPDDVNSCKKSELLPAGWNSCQDAYTLLYVHPTSRQVYLLKVIKVDSTLLAHFMRLDNEVVSDTMLDVSLYTTGDNSSYDSAYKNVEELQTKFSKEVLNPVLQPSTSSSRTKPSQSLAAEQRRGRPRDPHSEDDPLRVPPRHPQTSRPPEWGEPDDPFPSIGRGDLDPLAGGVGGGMMFDPMRFRQPFRGIDPSSGLPGRLPPGAVPPGARFDPFGPDMTPGNPRGRGRPGPDPDHLPPPGYDDMFM